MDLAREVSALSLVNLVGAGSEVTDRVLAIRNEAAVRKNMYTAHEITASEHAGWIRSLEGSPTRKFYAVMKAGAVIGGASVYDINPLHRRADWAYYLSGSSQGRGTGSALEFRFLDHIFAAEPVDKLNCEVIAFNAAVAKLHRRFGFVDEGVRRSHVVRDGETYDAILLGIKREEWAIARGLLTEKLFAGA